MDLISIARTIFRHKLAVIPAIIITALGIFYVIAIKPPEYQATATIVLISPPTPPSTEQIAADPKLAKINANNPYVDYGDLSIVADVVLSVVDSDASQQTLLSEGVDARSSAGPSPDSGAIIQVNGIGKSVQGAIQSANLVADATQSDLALLQERQKVNPAYMITSVILVRPQQAQLVLSGKLRYLIAVLALGVILLFISVSSAQAIENRRESQPGDADRPAKGRGRRTAAVAADTQRRRTETPGWSSVPRSSLGPEAYEHQLSRPPARGSGSDQP
jgi:capsular polysaccharide biosynthesis protein